MEKSPVEISVLSKLKVYLRTYPSQFWLLFWGMLVSTTGMSMIWPFLVVYIGEELTLPLTTITSLISINAVMSLCSSLIAGSITDKIGRKWAMVISLAVNGVTFLLMIPANTYGQYAVLMALRGTFQPLYRVGADAMIADLVPAGQRADAYALTRLSKNVGIAMGPALGGVIATTSYGITFSIASGATIFFSILIALFAIETLPDATRKVQERFVENLKGYENIFKDRIFTSFIAGFTLRQISGSILWVLLGAYAKTNYGLAENLYGLIPTANALMVVFLQLFVTRKTSRYSPLKIMSLGTLLYGIGVGSIAFGTGFWGFLVSMVIVTVGELMVIPTASTYTANRAPENMRGRYMSLLALTWGAGSLVGPLMGGFLNDNISPASIWYGGGAAGIMGSIIFLVLVIKTGGDKPAVNKPD
ncbi:MAG: MFS transporter [Anaerolineales bacterium]|nr:MFS transporter [Anaerolineales bacterium]